MEWKHETFETYEDAEAFAAGKKGAEIETKPGHAALNMKGDQYYPTPEDRPSWTVWWPV